MCCCEQHLYVLLIIRGRIQALYEWLCFLQAVLECQCVILMTCVICRTLTLDRLNILPSPAVSLKENAMFALMRQLVGKSLVWSTELSSSVIWGKYRSLTRIMAYQCTGIFRTTPSTPCSTWLSGQMAQQKGHALLHHNCAHKIAKMKLARLVVFIFGYLIL